ncbi:MAG: hypothetical protein IRY95_09860 [Clostridia bacterium]|nr:hypothetical protein [Clostridia bacterium]
MGWGRGDRLAPLAPPGPWPVVLANPGFPLLTGEVFRWWDESGGPGTTPEEAERRARSLQAALARGDREGLGRLLQNDLEAVVLPRFDVLRSLKGALAAAGALGCVLSGSGPTVVALARSWGHASALAAVAARLVPWVAVSAFRWPSRAGEAWA